MLSPIELPSVSDVIYRELKQRILNREFSPGQKLNLNQLEAQLDVSRTPLKSALARLQIEGLVEIHPRRGTYISEFSKQDIVECFELRIALEAQTLRYAFADDNQALLAQILRLLDEMESYFPEEANWLEQLPDYMERDRLLHRHFIELAHNSHIMQAYERANVQGYIVIMGGKFRYADTRKTQAEHREIANALQARDLPQLLTAARNHLEQACERAVHRLAEQEADE
ncbi:MAG: GntR family transcriptional regulator [Chloroflexi bacterium]|nr:MAG: GntR family transcriptional regulator [Chloroflexota bacterium]